MAQEDLAKGVSKFIRDIRSKVLSPDARQALSKAYALDAAAAIKLHTRRGFGLQNDGDNLSRLARLSPNYIQRRAQMRLSSETTPGTSNLTLRGKLLDSIIAKPFKFPNWAVAMPGEHYSGLTNRQLARYLSRKRPFLFLSANEQTRLGRAHAQRFNALAKRVN